MRYFQSLNPPYQIPMNFHSELSKIEQHITFDREMIST